MAEPEQSAEAVGAGEALFHKTTKRFKLIRALMYGLFSGFLVGYHARLTNQRVSRLQGSKHAKKLSEELRELSDADCAHFLGLATVNKEQAEAAFRYTAIINFTAPITLIVVVNQVFPTFFPWLFSSYLDVSGVRLGLIGLLFVVATVLPPFQAFAGVSLARDIYHLGLIESARRNNRPAITEDGADADTPNPTDL